MYETTPKESSVKPECLVGLRNEKSGPWNVRKTMKQVRGIRVESD